MCYDCLCLLLEYVVHDGDFAIKHAASGGNRQGCPACKLVDPVYVGSNCNIVSGLFLIFNNSFLAVSDFLAGSWFRQVS